MAVPAPAEQWVLWHSWNCPKMAQGTEQTAQGVYLAWKSNTYHSNQASVWLNKTNLIHRSYTLQQTGLKGSATTPQDTPLDPVTIPRPIRAKADPWGCLYGLTCSCTSKGCSVHWNVGNWSTDLSWAVFAAWNGACVCVCVCVCIIMLFLKIQNKTWILFWLSTCA